MVIIPLNDLLEGASMRRNAEVFLGGLGFPEDPRWHEGMLWFSDMDTRQVMKSDLEGNAEIVVLVEGIPSGLGWLPDGRLMVVSMRDRKLMRLDPSGLVEVADLWNLSSFHCNDMVVDQKGNAYIGNFGFDFEGLKPFAPGEIIYVPYKGTPRVVAYGLAFPNGMAITSDGKTLVVSETLGERVTAFDIESDGSLGYRRTWAALEKMTPDGITMDAEDAIWMASPISRGVYRVKEGGEICEKISVSQQAYSCTLGGSDWKTLLIATSRPLRELFVLKDAPLDSSLVTSEGEGRFEKCQVDVRGVGSP